MELKTRITKSSGITRSRQIARAMLALVMAVTFQAQASAVTTSGSGGVNAADQLGKPFLVLISIDGFRWDYMQRYPTPNLRRIAAAGLQAERLLPVFPTLTFPNHYSIATGLYPAQHGLVANEFPEPAIDAWYSLRNRAAVENARFYGGTPVWVAAETQGMVAAAFFFVGTEAPVAGVSPTHWRSYDKRTGGQERVDQVLEWLGQPESTRPHLYTLYFEDIDDHSHWYGPDSAENIEAIARVDGYIGRLLDGIESLPFADRIHVMVVSDHGQGAYVDGQAPYLLDEHVNIADTVIIEGGSYLFLHLVPDDPERAADIARAVNASWQHGRAYLPGDAPAAWRVDDNPRFPDVILMPNAGYAVLSSLDKIGKINAGDHGWAPEEPDMHGFLVACGPGIKPGLRLGPVRNIDLYPLMLSLLGLEIPTTIDGDPGALSAALNTSRRNQSCSKR